MVGMLCMGGTCTVVIGYGWQRLCMLGICYVRLAYVMYGCHRLCVVRIGYVWLA